MLKFLSRIFGKDSEPVAEEDDAPCDAQCVGLPPEVQEMRRQREEVKQVSDRAEAQLDHKREIHRETLMGAQTSFSGINGIPGISAEDLAKAKEKWLEENKKSGTAPA